MKTMGKRQVVVFSGINLYEGGPLSIYYDCLDNFIRDGLDRKYKVYAFVHKLQLFKKYDCTEISFIELPKSRDSYINRLFYEYVYFNSFSNKNEVDYWISLHDITPRTKAKKTFTYCHNPSPFRKISLFDFKMGIKNNVIFPLFYKWVYRINIKAATGVIVQENWMRSEFKKMFGLKNIIVARPNIETDFISNSAIKKTKDSEIVFFFPGYPRVFKNMNVICEAAKILEDKNRELRIKILLTLNGTENKYSQYLYEKYGKCKYIEWLGIIPREEVFNLYNSTDYLIFPSKLESWGLPITEFEKTNKPMIVADMPYAHETVGNYTSVVFFDPDDPRELADIIMNTINGEQTFFENIMPIPEQPFAKDWNELFELIFE